MISGTGATAPPLGPGNQYKPYSTQNAHSASYVAVALDSRAPLSRGVFRPGPVGRGALPGKNRFLFQAGIWSPVPVNSWGPSFGCFVGSSSFTHGGPPGGAEKRTAIFLQFPRKHPLCTLGKKMRNPGPIGRTGVASAQERSHPHNGVPAVIRATF